MRAFLLALTFLTVIRVPSVTKFKEQDFPRSVYVFGTVGLLIGLIQLTIAWTLLQTRLPDQIVAVVVVLAGVVITGGLHIDGVADSIDGFGAGRDRESILRIMKDKRLGVYGITAIFFVLYTKIVATGAILDLNLPLLLLSPVISRSMLALSCALLPYARKEGTGRMFVENTALRNAIFPLIACVLISLLISPASGWFFVLVNILVCLIFLLYCKHKIGGITGDTLGLQNEISEIIVLLCGLPP